MACFFCVVSMSISLVQVRAFNPTTYLCQKRSEVRSHGDLYEFRERRLRQQRISKNTVDTSTCHVVISDPICQRNRKVEESVENARAFDTRPRAVSIR